MKKSFLLFVMVPLLLVIAASLATAQVWYVRADANGIGTGTSWTDAFPDLQLAIDLASDEDTICVAAGTYFPSLRIGGDSLRHSTFYIQKAIRLYGGFEGTPGSEGDFQERDPDMFPAILSGDVGVPGDTVDNAFHVVTIDHVSDTMRLDGFIIRDGNGFGGNGLESSGAGILINAEQGRSHPQIFHCEIKHNSVPESGGGVMVNAGFGGRAHPFFSFCTFSDNRASGGGGYFGYTDSEGEDRPTFVSCRFRGNTARTAQGSAIGQVAHSSTNQTLMYNCILTGNHSPFSSAVSIFITGTGIAQPDLVNCTLAGNHGGSVRVSDIGAGSSALSIRNSIIWGNSSGSGVSVNGCTLDMTYTIVQDGIAGEGNLAEDPLFVELPLHQNAPHLQGDVHVMEGSPAIDAGRDSDLPFFIMTDADGLPRFVNPMTHLAGTIDIGAFEVQEITVSDIRRMEDLLWKIYPNPVQEKLVIEMPFDAGEVECRLLDHLGRLVRRKIAMHGEAKMTLDVSDVPYGVYYIQLYQDQNIYIRQFIKHE